MRISNMLIGSVIGAFIASIGGLARYLLVFGHRTSLDIVYVGIVLPYYLCFLMPIIGGLAGWIGAKIASKNSTSKKGALLGGLLGGVAATLIFIPYPLAI